MVASAAKGDKGFTYDLDVTFTNPVTIVDVSGVPTVNTNFSLKAGAQGVAMTDGSGKLDGVWDMYITNLTDATPLVDVDMIVDISGSITTTTTTGNPTPTPVVNMTLKGNGQSHDDANTTNGTASMSLTFNTKNGGGLKTNSSIAGPFTTNVYVVTDLGNGNFFTNPIPQTYSPVTNTTVTSGPTSLSYLTFTVHSSDTNVSPVDNRVFEQSQSNATNGTPVTFFFGSGTLVSNLYFLFGTNLFQITQLGTTVDYSASQALGATNPIVNFAITNPIYGIDAGSLSSFINAFEQANTATASSTNKASLVSGVVTNFQTSGPGSTNITVAGLPLFSNSWLEVSGLVNGSVKSGKKSIPVKNASGLFTTPHSVYTPFTLTNVVGSNTFTTNYVLKQSIGGGSIDLEKTTSFSAKVVQFNKTLYSSSGDPYKGTGTLNPTKTKQTYTLNLKGVSQSRGSTLTFKGNTDSNYVAGFSVETNVVTITNLASIAKFFHTFTNTTGFPQRQSFQETVTNTVVTGTSTNTVISHNGYGLNNVPLFPQGLTIPGLGKTNIDTLGIRTVTATGKIKGQALPKTGISGVNPDNGF